MNAHTTGRGLALVAGVIATIGAGAILLQDAICSGHWTLEHALVPALMAVQILTGHLFVTALRQWRLLPAAGFLVVAIIATWGVLYTSVGKQSTVVAEAESAAKYDADRRSAAEARRSSNQDMLDEERRKMAKECGTGDGDRCKGKLVTIQVYADAVAGAQAELDEIGPEKPLSLQADKMAEIISLARGYDFQTTRHILLLVEPFTRALVFELAALVSFGFAFGSRNHVSDAPPATGRHGKQENHPRQTQAQSGKHPVIAALEVAGGSVGSNNELAELMGVTAGEASKRVAEVRHMLACHRHGKANVISLLPRA